MIIIVFGVVLIAFGSSNDDLSVDSVPIDSENQTKYLCLAILFALLSGVMFSVNGLCMRAFVNGMGISAMQLTCDGFLFTSFFLLALYLNQVYHLDKPYESRDILLAILASFLSMIGTIAMT